MRTVLVLGAGGAGKTVLARELSARTGIPVVHLDALYYDQAWQPRPMEDFAAAQRRILERGAVILDGNYLSTLVVRLPGSDTVIFLDVPAWRCLLGIARRRWRYRGGQHADGTFDRISVSFLRYAAGYRRRARPRVLALIAEHAPDADVVRLTSRRQIRRFLAGVPGG